MLHDLQAELRLHIPKLIGWDRDGRPRWQVQGAATGVSMSTFLANKLLDHLLSQSTYTAPATTYISLYTAAPGDAGGGTEVSGGAYARVAYTNSVANWPAASGSSKSNANIIDFGTATANWGTVVAAGVHDAVTAGNLLLYGTLTASKTINNGDGARYLANQLIVAFD
jgi:hypothetical protein